MTNLHFIKTPLEGLLLIQSKKFNDERGSFMELYSKKEFEKHGIPEFVQDNCSSSRKGVLRGMHAQLDHPQGKLVRATQGEIYDVAVDVRPDSKTFGKWESFILSAENGLQVYVPPGFLHGFYATSETAGMEYNCTDYYYPGDEIGMIWNDSSIGIGWPTRRPILSPKDAKLPAFEKIKEHFEAYRRK